jgi:hypothetical protein
MADQDKITADDLLGGDVIKRFDDLNKKLLETLTVMGNVSKTAIILDQSLKNQKTTADELGKTTQKVNDTKKKLTDAEKEAIKIEQLQQKMIGSQVNSLQRLTLQNRLLVTERNKLDTSTKAGQKRVAEINKTLDKNTETIKNNSSATEKQRMNIGNYKSALDGLPGPIGGFVSGMQRMTKAALTFLATPIGWFILAIVAALGSLMSYFKRSEEGQNALSKVTKVFEVILGNLLDVLSKVGKALFEAVTKPKEAWQGFKDFIEKVGVFFQETFGNVIGGSIDVFTGFLQKAFANIGFAWQKLKGVFVDNTNGINEAQKKIAEYDKKIEDGQDRVKEGATNLKEGVIGAYSSMKGAISDFVKETQREIDIAKKLADAEAALTKTERKDLVENAKLRGSINKLRADAEEKKKIDAESSIEDYRKVFELENKIAANELNISTKRADYAKLNATFSDTNKETLMEIARLETDVVEKQNAFEQKRRDNLKALNRLRMEAFRQEEERAMVGLETAKIVSDTQITFNKQLIEDEKSTYKQRLKATYDNAESKLKAIEDTALIEQEVITKQLEYQLINAKDGAAELEKIEKDKNKKILEVDIELDKNLKSIQAQRLSDMDRQANAEVNILTEKYLAGEVTAQQFADRQIEIQMATVEAELALGELSVDQRISLEQKYNDLKLQLLEKEKAAQQEIYNQSIELANAFFDFKTGQRDAELTAIETKKAFEIEMAGDNVRQKERIEKKYAKEAAKLKREQAEADKRQAIFNAIINTAGAVVKALNNPWPLNLVLAVLMGALGGVQIATIVNKPIPKFARGIKRGFAGGEVEVGEAGYEAVKLPGGQTFLTPDKATKMVLPKGAQIFTHNETQEMLNGGATVEKWDEMIKEQKATRKALSNKIEHNTQITSDGMKYIVKKSNQSITYIDKYFRC